MNDNLRDFISAARGRKPADLALKGGSIVNVFSGEIYKTEVAVHNGRIAGLGEYEGREVIDVASKIIIPGLIDSHVHLESSMLTPAEFAMAAIVHGCTTVIADPHEIANVLGKKGIRYMLRASEGLPVDFYFMLPSCVPATGLETSGASLSAADLKPFLSHKRVLGLAEMMNYPGVLSADRAVLGKLKAFGHTVIDGHAPGLSGKDLAAYVGSGITSDHECATADEALEKIRLGMTVYIREGSSARNLEAILPAVTKAGSRFFTFSTDDLEPDDLMQGGINLIIRKAVRLGLDPVSAVRMATINPALHFGMKRKGALAPGYDADMVVIDDLENFNVEMVFRQGRLVSRNGKLLRPVRAAHHREAKGSVRMRPLSVKDMELRARSGMARVIELIPGQIETRHSIMEVALRDGLVVSDTERDILKLIVIERHRASGNVGLGLVKGFGLKSGALGSTVAHDSHNLIVVGADDKDILRAAGEIRRMQGGLVVVNKGKTPARLPLPIAGLMSDKNAGFVAGRLRELEAAARSLGAGLAHPFGVLSFLALPVIPELKLTDRGLVDVNKFRFTGLFV